MAAESPAGCDWKWVRGCRLKPAFQPQRNAGFSRQLRSAHARNASVEAERRLRSAPVLGRSNLQKSKGRENLNARALMETAAPEDGRTPPPSLRHYHRMIQSSLGLMRTRRPLQGYR